MYSLKTKVKGSAFIILTSLFLNVISINNISAQDDCAIEKDHEQGYTTAISSVIENSNNSHTIGLNVKHNGCSGNCKALAHYYAEEVPGTYSDVVVSVIEDILNYENINFGTDLGGDNFT